jgi:hypothetical protein
MGLARKLNSDNSSASRADHWNPHELLTKRELASTRFCAALAWLCRPPLGQQLAIGFCPYMSPPDTDKRGDRDYNKRKDQCTLHIYFSFTIAIVLPSITINWSGFEAGVNRILNSPTLPLRRGLKSKKRGSGDFARGRPDVHWIHFDIQVRDDPNI